MNIQNIIFIKYLYLNNLILINTFQTSLYQFSFLLFQNIYLLICSLMGEGGRAGVIGSSTKSIKIQACFYLGFSNNLFVFNSMNLGSKNELKTAL